MATAHLVVIACMVGEPHTCKEIPLLDKVSQDVAVCTSTAPTEANKWQDANMDFHVIGSKCILDEQPAPAGQQAPVKPKAPADDSAK